jgi:hypothetical protein
LRERLLTAQLAGFIVSTMRMQVVLAFICLTVVTIGSQAVSTCGEVLEDPSSADLTAAGQQLEYVLKTPQRLPQILNLVDDVMKARLQGVHQTKSGT